MRIIPAIDIIEGKCVRLSKGDYDTKKVYSEDPLEMAKSFEAHGIQHLHLVDLDGARSSHIVNYSILEEIASKTGMQVDFGGGLKSDEDLRIAFECGANQVTGGSIAVKNKEIFLGWLEKYGWGKIILGADAMDEKIAVSGWQEGTGQQLIPFIKSYINEGVKYVICTDISKDGMLEGPSTDLYQRILAETGPDHQPDTETGIYLIASGGITGMDDLYDLKALGCEGAILGKAIYENRIKLKELEQFILNK
jgi:phosphoribosylformimino-5-aminoimidazole carboxamide ribotide isomerase